MSQTVQPTRAMDAPATGRSGWLRGRGVVTLVLLALAVLACMDAWLDILRIVQKDEEASHIILVPLVFARLLWVRRKMLADWTPRASLWGVAITLVGVGLWVTGYIRAVQVVWHLGAVVTVFGAFVSVNGLDIVRRLWPAFAVLVFLLPMPGSVRQPLALFLQNMSAKATEVVIIALGFDLRRYGNLLIINDYTVGIAEACNGMRMVSMLILIVFAFIFSEKVRTWVRLTLIVAAVPIAILCNIIRLVPTVLAYGYFSPGFAEALHDWLGWGLAFASYFGLMGALWLMRWLLLPVDPRRRYDWKPRGRRRLAVPGRILALFHEDPSKPGHPALMAGGVVAVLALAFAIGAALPDGQDAGPYHARVRAVAAQLPREAGPWTATDTPTPEAAVALLRPNVLISRRYDNQQTSQSLGVLVVQCADARDMEGHYPPNCYPTSGWSSLGTQPTTLQIGGLDVQAVDYRFQRISAEGLLTINVINLIVLPGDGFVTTMASIRRLAGTVSDRYYGAAQIQFVFYGQWERDQRLAVVQQVGATYEPLIRAMMDKSDETQGP